MKLGKLLPLLVAAVLVTVAAVTVYNKDHRQSSTAKKRVAKIALGENILQGLDDAVDQIAFVEIRKKDEETLGLQRGDNAQWKIESHAGYPADSKKVQRLVLQLLELKVADQLTQNPEKYERFGVMDEMTQWGVLTLRDKNGEALRVLRIGNERNVDPDSQFKPTGRQQIRYYRVDDDPSVYLGESNLYWITSQMKNWADTKILSIAADRIRSIQVDHLTTGSLELEWQGEFASVNALPDGFEVDTAESNAARNAIASLALDDVLSADSVRAQSIDYQSTYTATTDDGLVIQLSSGQLDDDWFARIESRFEKPQPSADDLESTTSLASFESRVAEAELEAENLEAQHRAWVYKLASWRVDGLQKTHADVIKKSEVGDNDEDADGNDALSSLESLTKIKALGD